MEGAVVRHAAAGKAAGRSKLALEAGPLRPALAAAMRQVLAYAGHQASRAGTHPTEAVHELRKSLRRARALLQLCRRLIGKPRARALEQTLREVQGRASALRDADVLLDLADRLAARLTRGPRRALAAFAAELRAADRQARGQGAAVLAGSVGQLEAVGLRFGLALPAQVEWRDLRRGLRAVYRRARRALARSRQHPHDDDAFHTWRKRTKVLSYALELVASRQGTRKMHRRCADLAEAQGEVTDLLVLRDHLRPFAVARPDPDTAELLEEIRRRVQHRRRAVERQGQRALGPGARRFARQVVRRKA